MSVSMFYSGINRNTVRFVYENLKLLCSVLSPCEKCVLQISYIGAQSTPHELVSSFESKSVWPGGCARVCACVRALSPLLTVPPPGTVAYTRSRISLFLSLPLPSGWVVHGSHLWV